MYRPRRARESPLFRLVEQHLEEFLRVYPERFAKQHGPLRPVVERVLRGFLDHLGLSTPEAGKPPPLRVAEQAEGWGVPVEWE